MSFLEFLPNEIFIQIACNLSTNDLQACRLVSRLIRQKIDTLFNDRFCIILNEKSERHLVSRRRPAVIPRFTRMKIEAVSCFMTNVKNNRMGRPLRKEYFKNITELEITEFVPKYYFHQILKMTENLHTLSLSSAILGGTQHLFGKGIQNNSKPEKSKLLFIRRALPQTLIDNIRQREENNRLAWQARKNKKWAKLEVLHIKLDYVCPSTPNFSPLYLLENLRAIQYLPVPNLSAFNLTVEKSKDGEMFFFTIRTLLESIPLTAYSSLKSISLMSPKCRPISQLESLEKSPINKDKFSQMQLSSLTVKISEGQGQAIPENLIAILEAHEKSLTTTVSLEGLEEKQNFISS